MDFVFLEVFFRTWLLVYFEIKSCFMSLLLIFSGALKLDEA
jgi:hypothetical protein